MCYYGVMIDFTVKGAIFDIDDTLLDNKPDISGGGLHERSRLQAVQEVGKKHGIKELEHISIKDNWDAFQTAPVHTIESAVWNMFVRAGLADSVVPNLDDPLLKEIVKRKDELHEVIMIEEADEVAGASASAKKVLMTAFRLKESLLRKISPIPSQILRYLIEHSTHWGCLKRIAPRSVHLKTMLGELCRRERLGCTSVQSRRDFLKKN